MPRVSVQDIFLCILAFSGLQTLAGGAGKFDLTAASGLPAKKHSARTTSPSSNWFLRAASNKVCLKSSHLAKLHQVGLPTRAQARKCVTWHDGLQRTAERQIHAIIQVSLWSELCHEAEPAQSRLQAKHSGTESQTAKTFS